MNDILMACRESRQAVFCALPNPYVNARFGQRGKAPVLYALKASPVALCTHWAGAKIGGFGQESILTETREYDILKRNRSLLFGPVFSIPGQECVP